MAAGQREQAGMRALSLPANCSEAAGAALQAAGSPKDRSRSGLCSYHFCVCHHYQYCSSIWRGHPGSPVSTRKDTQVSKGRHGDGGCGLGDVAGGRIKIPVVMNE